MDAYRLALDEKEYLIGMRSHFHQNPEWSGKEFGTTSRICEELDKMGIPYTRLPRTGVLATIKGKKDHPFIGLRADIDALPITERSCLPYKSANDGAMHACGHDAHTSMLLGAAKIFSQNRDMLNCTLRLIFQPAEELNQGALTLLDLKEVTECGNVMAIHMFPYLPAGTVSVEAGPRFSAADNIAIKIKGVGGHGSMPHLTVDPILAASAVVNNLQTIVSRETNPSDACVVSICSFHAGTQNNIIPSEALLLGTARMFNPEVQKDLPGRIERIVAGTCETLRATYEYDYSYGTPVTINDASSSSRAENAVRKILGDKGLVKCEKITLGEDFSWLLGKIPGCLALLGCRSDERDAVYPLHHEKFNIDEDVLVNGAALFVQYVLETQDSI